MIPNMIDQSNLRSELSKRIVIVTFKKVDGDIRVMNCTTNLDLVPPSAWPQDKVKISEQAKEKTIRVYDLKAKGWRSFIIENVIDFE